MIVGFDNDDAGIFDDQYEFLQRAGMPIVMLGILQAIPRTPLYDRLQKAGRLRAPIRGTNTRSFTNIEPLRMSYEALIDGYRELFQRIYTWQAVGDRWLDNVEQWGNHEGRRFIQKPLGRFRPFLLKQTAMIAWYYLTGGRQRLGFAWRMLWGTLRRAPSALFQTVAYMAYFIHLREYADRVVAREYKFDYALTGADGQACQSFGEGGAIDMVRSERSRATKRISSSIGG